MMLRTAARALAVVTIGILIVLFLGSPAAAQENARADVGISWALLHESDLTMPVGWAAALAFHMTDRVTIVGEVGGNYKTMEEFGVDVDVNEHSFLGGVRSQFGTAKVKPFVQTLAGFSRLGGGADVGGFNVGVSVNAFTLQPGGGVDFYVSPKIAVRAQTDLRWLFPEDVDSTLQIRVAAGVVFALGSR